MDGLLDTGASSSIIDGHTARMLMRSGHVLHHDSNIVFIMAAGRTKGTGYIRANISWGPDHSMDHTFLVLEDCADSLLLGRDFMFHSGITPCIRKHGYYIETDEDQDKNETVKRQQNVDFKQLPCPKQNNKTCEKKQRFFDKQTPSIDGKKDAQRPPLKGPRPIVTSRPKSEELKQKRHASQQS